MIYGIRIFIELRTGQDWQCFIILNNFFSSGGSTHRQRCKEIARGGFITTKQVNTTTILKDLINKIKLKKNMSKPLDKRFQGYFVQGDAAM